MRLIGNKTKLLPAIEDLLRARGVTGGSLLDVFAGTASVARHFRARGFDVASNDLLFASWVHQRATVGTGRLPDLGPVLATPSVRRFALGAPGRAAAGEVAPALAPLAVALAWLEREAPPQDGLVARQFSEGGPAGRLYFSRDNGRRIDGAHAALAGWRAAGLLCEQGFHLLLAALLDAADRVANISGTYGAFLKRLQASAREPLRLRPPPLLLDRPAGRVFREDANALVRRLEVDVLYVDPPYNQRQYVKNYHVLEVLAELHTVADPAAYEASLYGKTGLRGFDDRLSAYCKRARRGGVAPALAAFEDLVAHARAEHVVVSYSEEGILDREAIGAALARATGARRFDFARDFEEVRHKRFRSDRDRAPAACARVAGPGAGDAGAPAHAAAGGAPRAYRVLEGRERDEVREWLFYARKPAALRRGRRPAGSAVRAGASRRLARSTG